MSKSTVLPPFAPSCSRLVNRLLRSLPAPGNSIGLAETWIVPFSDVKWKKNEYIMHINAYMSCILMSPFKSIVPTSISDKPLSNLLRLGNFKNLNEWLRIWFLFAKVKEKAQPIQIPETSSFALLYIIFCIYTFSSFSSPSENITDFAVSFAGASFFASESVCVCVVRQCANVEQAGLGDIDAMVRIHGLLGLSFWCVWKWTMLCIVRG